MASYREQGPTERFEKRKLFRFPVQLPAQLGRVEDASSICTNLSTSGASFETAIILSVGERLSLSVIIAPKEEPLRMVGQVVWKKDLQALNLDSAKLREVGIRFLRPLPSLEKHENEAPTNVPIVEDEEEDFIFPERTSNVGF